MLAATKVKMSRSEEKSKPEHIRYFLHKKCHVHLKFHVVVMQNNDKKMYKKVYYTCKVFFFGQLDLSVFLIVLVVFAV